MQEDSGPRRESLRQKGIQADGSRIDYERRNGEVRFRPCLWTQKSYRPAQQQPLSSGEVHRRVQQSQLLQGVPGVRTCLSAALASGCRRAIIPGRNGPARCLALFVSLVK